MNTIKILLTTVFLSACSGDIQWENPIVISGQDAAITDSNEVGDARRIAVGDYLTCCVSVPDGLSCNDVSSVATVVKPDDYALIQVQTSTGEYTWLPPTACRQ